VADAMVLDTVIVDIRMRYKRSKSRYSQMSFIRRNEHLSRQLQTNIEKLLGSSIYQTLPVHLRPGLTHTSQENRNA
jgi:hypothetical protein